MGARSSAGKMYVTNGNNVDCFDLAKASSAHTLCYHYLEERSRSSYGIKTGYINISEVINDVMAHVVNFPMRLSPQSDGQNVEVQQLSRISLASKSVVRCGDSIAENRASRRHTGVDDFISQKMASCAFPKWFFSSTRRTYVHLDLSPVVLNLQLSFLKFYLSHEPARTVRLSSTDLHLLPFRHH